MTARRTIDVDDVTLAYIEYGERKPLQSTILILHGLVAEAETFAALAAQLQPRHIIALDMPGNGVSQAAGDASFHSISEIVQKFAAALGLERPVMLGHSHGGAIALRIAANDPEWPSALVLLCPAHPFSRKEDTLVGFYLSPPGRLFARSIPKMPTWLHRAAFKFMPGMRNHLGDVELAPYLRSLRRQDVIVNTLALLATWHKDMRILEGDLRKRRPSTRALLVWGSKDIVVPPSTAARLVEQLPNAEVVVLKGVGHLPNEEAPIECGRIIDAWLRTREADDLAAREVEAQTRDRLA
jgi:pimeloyl-ACP methyl ester carboxylesterase